MKSVQYRMYFVHKTTLFKGEEGDESLVQNKKVQSVPGLLATIVGLFQKAEL